MKKSVMYFGVLVLSLLASSCNEIINKTGEGECVPEKVSPKSDLQLEKIKGHVKSYSERTFLGVKTPNGDIVKGEELKKRDGYRFERFYDKKGNLVKKQTYMNDKPYGTICHSYVYKKDTLVHYFRSYCASKYYEKEVIVYDKWGHTIEIKNYEGGENNLEVLDSWRIQRYNHCGLMIEEVYKKTESKGQYWRNEYSYDEGNNLKESVYYDEFDQEKSRTKKNSTKNKKEVNTYDDLGNIIKSTGGYSLGEFIVEYKYDENNNCIQEDYHSSSFEEFQTRTFDSQGNFLTWIGYKPNKGYPAYSSGLSNPDIIILERTYDYYP